MGCSKIQPVRPTMNIYEEFMAFTDDPTYVEDINFEYNGIYSPTSGSARRCNMQQTSGDYSTHQVTEAVGDMTLERPTQSGVDPQCQDPDNDTPVSSMYTPPYSPSLVRSRNHPLVADIDHTCEPTDIKMEEKLPTDSADLISMIKVEET